MLFVRGCVTFSSIHFGILEEKLGPLSEFSCLEEVFRSQFSCLFWKNVLHFSCISQLFRFLVQNWSKSSIISFFFDLSLKSSKFFPGRFRIFSQNVVLKVAHLSVLLIWKLTFRLPLSQNSKKNYRRIYHLKFLAFRGSQLEYNGSQGANRAG